jgi:hypothetical protein
MQFDFKYSNHYGGACTTAHVYRSDDNFVELVLFVYFSVCSKNLIQFIHFCHQAASIFTYYPLLLKIVKQTDFDCFHHTEN